MKELPDDIADCETDRERASWLLRCPLATLMRDEGHIRLWLRYSQFRAGLTYLETELSCLREPRREDGWLTSLVMIAVARGRMYRVACGLAAFPWGT